MNNIKTPDNVITNELGMFTDAVEKSPQYLAIADELQQLLDEKFPPDELQLGRCHQIWAYKKQLLRDRFGIT